MTDQHSPTTITPERFIADAIARLEMQAAASDQLADLAREQGALIETGQADELLGVLTQRQHLIDELLAVVTEIGPLADAVQHSPAGVSEVQRQSVKRLVDTIGARLAEIIDIDSRDRTKLEHRLAEVKRERNINTSVRTARTAYGRAKPVVGTLGESLTRFTDQQG